MASEWPTRRLADVAENTSRPFDFSGRREVTFINTGDVLQGKFLHHDRTRTSLLPGQAKKRIERNDILLSEIRPGNGRFAFVNFQADDYVVSTKFMVITPKGDILPTFLYLVLTHSTYLNEFQRIAESRSGTFPQITFDSIADCRVPVPPIAIQERILGFINAIDGKLDVLREEDRALEQIESTIFKSWFLNFDPVSASTKGGVQKRIFTNLFPKDFEESALGLIPKGWMVGRLDDLLVLQRGFDLPTTNREPGRYPIFSASGRSGTHSEYRVRGPGVTTGRSGLIGKVFFVHEDFWPLNTSLWVKEYRRSCPVHAFYLLQDLKLDTFNAGSAVPTLNRNHVHGLPVVVPPLAVVEAFEKLVSPMLELRRDNERQSETIAAIRDVALPKLMFGQIRLKKAEMIVVANA